MGCDTLGKFYGELSSLKSAQYMYNNCYKLSDIRTIVDENNVIQNGFGELEDAYMMFAGCRSLVFP